MINFRRSHRPKNERSSLGVECDPFDIAKMDAEGDGTELNIKYPTNRTSKPMPVVTTKADMGKTVQDPEKQEKSEEQHSRSKPFRARKNQLSKTIKLQSASINFDTNVYSLAVNDTDNRQTYLSTLYNEIETLRGRIQFLEGDQNGTHYKGTLNYDEESPTYAGNNYSQDRSRTIQDRSRAIQARRSKCGKLYSRGQGLNSDRRSSVHSNKQPQSTWRPQGKKMPISQFDSHSKDANQFSQVRKEPAESAVRPVSNYRVKQNSKRYGDKANQQVGKFRPAGRSASLRKRQQSAREQVKKEIPEQLKPVFAENPQWQITGINDDFRTKIMNKIQIPAGFPVNIPQETDNLEEYYRISKDIYAVFNVDIQKCRQKLVVRRFKNGVYLQLKPNKNIVWYFHGTFYFGQWQTDLPSQGDKNGFGFEYVPKKYFYLGNFKDGMRHGKGTIKIIHVDESNQDCFMCYDGEWSKGKPSGFGKQIDEKDNKFMGDFLNGEKIGDAIILNRDGLYYQGKVKNGLKHGYGVQKLVNGDTYMGHFIDGKFEGHGIYKWNNGSMYEGEFLRGKREGRGKWKSYNGDEFDGDYVNDIKHGWGKFTWENGEMYEGEFRKDIRHGPGTYKHPSGKMGKFMWIDGQIDHRLYSKQEQEYRCRNIRKQGKQ